jgi:hypothetical protein
MILKGRFPGDAGAAFPLLCRSIKKILNLKIHNVKNRCGEMLLETAMATGTRGNIQAVLSCSSR